MKETEKEVKSKGDVLGKVVVQAFDSCKDAIKFFVDEAKVVALINRQHMSDVTNEYRGAHTRTSTPIARLNRMAKTNPKLAGKIEALIAEYAKEEGA